MATLKGWPLVRGRSKYNDTAKSMALLESVYFIKSGHCSSISIFVGTITRQVWICEMFLLKNIHRQCVYSYGCRWHFHRTASFALVDRVFNNIPISKCKIAWNKDNSRQVIVIKIME